MAAKDKTRIAKPSPIVEDEQGQLIAQKGISREVIEELSKIKGEPQWMRDLRVKSYEIFSASPSPPGAWTCPTSTSTSWCSTARPRPAATTPGTTSRRR